MNKGLREGTHYAPRDKKKNKRTYIEEIIVESTGVSKDNDILFPAAKARVNRILKRVIEFTGEERLKTDIKFKAKIIQIVSKVYFSDYGMQNLTRMLNNKLEIQRNGDSGGEDGLWSTLAYIESIVGMPIEPLPPFYQNESQEFQEIMNAIVENLYMDMHLVSQLIGDEEKKMELIREYLWDQKDEEQTGFFESWRKEIWDFNREKTKSWGKKTIVGDSV